jgi:hypothetical protein
MVEYYGNYELDFQEGFVRILVANDEYEYLVSKELFGPNAHTVTRLFQIAFLAGKRNVRRQIKEILGL